MKINKKFILPAIALFAFAAVGVGSTYAIFTSRANTNVAVTAGKVKVEATVSDLRTYSAEYDEYGDVLDENGNTYSLVETTNGTFANGGTATVEEGAIKLLNVTPGDKATAKITIKNNSNVGMKYRIGFEAEGNLLFFAGIEFKIGDNQANGVKKYSTEWSNVVAPGSDDIETPVEVYLPLSIGNSYQDQTCSIKYTVEAVQGNAYVSNEQAVEEKILVANKATAQDVFLGKYGSLNNSTVVITESLDSKVMINLPSKYENSGTVCHDGSITAPALTPAEYVELSQDGAWHGTPIYERDIENLTITSVPGVTVTSFGITSGHSYGANVTDYVRDYTSTVSQSVFYSYTTINGLTFKDLSFVGSSESEMLALDITSGARQNKVQNVVVDGCNFVGGASTASAIHCMNNGGDVDIYRGITVKNSTFNMAQSTAAHTYGFLGLGTGDLYIDNCSFKDTTRTIQTQSGGNQNEYGVYSVTNCIFDNVKSYLIKAAEITELTKIVVTGNTAINVVSGSGVRFATSGVEYATTVPEGVEVVKGNNDFGTVKINEFLK